MFNPNSHFYSDTTAPRPDTTALRYIILNLVYEKAAKLILIS